MNEYIKSYKFLKVYKFRIFAMILFIILSQFCLFLTPLIIQNIIDRQLLGITSGWVIVTSSDENTINYQEKFMKPTNLVDDTDIIVKEVEILLLDDQFYYIDEKVANGTRSSVVGDSFSVLDQTYHAEVLSAETVKLFYSPFTSNLIKMVIILFVVSVFTLIFTYLKEIIGAYILMDVTRDVRCSTIKKMYEIDINELEYEPAGKTANRLINDATGPGNLYASSINVVLQTIISLIFAYIGIFILNARVAMYCLLLIPIMVIWIIIYNKYLKTIIAKINETNSLIVGYINEIINGITILKSFNANRKTVKSFGNLNDEFIDYTMTEQKMHVKTGWSALNMFQGTISGLIVITLGYMYLNGNTSIEPGMVNSYYSFIVKIISPFGLLFSTFSIISNDRDRVNRVFKLLNFESEDIVITKIDKFENEIEFKNVGFKYGENEVIKNLNLKIKAQTKIGLIGKTGSGKTTMMNLLLRFNDVTTGEILMDSKNINLVSKRSYRQNIAIIQQEPILFSGTLYDNIAYGQKIDHNYAKKLLIEVGGKMILDKHSNGIMHEIDSKGSNMSIGEKQLICFARILALDPDIIILDEATANIDSTTELQFNQALARVSLDKTLIVIAHRISTIVDCDEIHILEHGKIKISGNHKFLLENSKYYKNLF